MYGHSYSESRSLHIQTWTATRTWVTLSTIDRRGEVQVLLTTILCHQVWIIPGLSIVLLNICCTRPSYVHRSLALLSATRSASQNSFKWNVRRHELTQKLA